MSMAALKIEPTFTKRMGALTNGALYACYQCGTCTAICPMEVPTRALIRAAQLGTRERALDEGRLWYCTACKQCELSCPRGVAITDVIHAVRVAAFEGRKAPQKLEQALWGVYEDGNPWGSKKEDRAKWADGTGIKVGKPAKTLLYVGCETSFDSRLQRVARSLATILTNSGVDFSILGQSESCCGDVVNDIGEEAYLEELAKKNIDAFRQSGAERIVAISPHSYNMFKAIYPKYGEMPEVLHYTQLLASLLDKGNLKPARPEGELLVTYHDPCFLGRYHGIYEEPRKLIEAVPGIKLEEMDDSRGNAVCCGGGGGLMWTDFEGERPSAHRTRQAADTGASTLVTSCPYCIQNFEDSVRTGGSSLSVSDVTEILTTGKS